MLRKILYATFVIVGGFLSFVILSGLLMGLRGEDIRYSVAAGGLRNVAERLTGVATCADVGLVSSRSLETARETVSRLMEVRGKIPPNSGLLAAADDAIASGNRLRDACPNARETPAYVQLMNQLQSLRDAVYFTAEMQKASELDELRLQKNELETVSGPSQAAHPFPGETK